LAGDIDQIRQRVENVTNQQSIDDLLDVLDMDELSQRFGVSPDSMRKKLTQSGGKVFKLGKKYVIRKITFLGVMENLERDVNL